MSDKERIIRLLKKLPADVSLKEIGAEIDFLATLRKGEEQADHGEVVPHE